MKRTIMFIATVLLIVTGCGPSAKELQQQAAQKAEAARLQYNKEVAAKVAADAAEEAAYEAAYAKRKKDGEDCETRYPNADPYIYPGKDYPVTKEILESGETRRSNPNYSWDDYQKMDECIKAVYFDDSPENRTIKAHETMQLERDRRKMQEILANDPYAFCGMVEGAACRH